MIQTEENNTVQYSRRVAVTPEQGKANMSSLRLPRILGITPVYGQTQYRAVLVQYRSDLPCFPLTTRIGLKPLREMTSLVPSMTVHSPISV